MIVLSTLNARYIHPSLGLRYLRANLGPWREQSIIEEFIIKTPPQEVVDRLLAHNPQLVGFGVYIWNTSQTLEVVRRLKTQAPQVLIVLGGPEVSYEAEDQELLKYVDFVFQGESDFTFRDFIQRWKTEGVLPEEKIIRDRLPEIRELRLPYSEYTDDDVKNRTIYVEASRGCPYKCEYCLSSLDTSVRNFDLPLFLTEMQSLLDRGVRKFKFVDRTFNLAPKVSTSILQFFLDRKELGLFLHFEMVPDRLPAELKTLIEQFPAGALQFEIGIQTWNPIVARNVSRRQNYVLIEENLKYLREKTHVHTHADLIVGLPGETFASFRDGFNQLYRLAPDEIQVGLLKRLKGTPITKKEAAFSMVYDSPPPFQILKTRDLNQEEVFRLKVFADFWDHLANSGRFLHLRPWCEQLGANPFDFYYEMSQWLHSHFQRTHSIHLKDLESALQNYFKERGWPEDLALAQSRSGHAPALAPGKASPTPTRQARHLGRDQSPQL